MSKKKFTFIDLFAGCGGLSEGFLQTGRYEALAHVEWEKPMVETLRHRLVTKWGETEEEAKRKVILFDIQKTDELIDGLWSDDANAKYGLQNSDDVKTRSKDRYCLWLMSQGCRKSLKRLKKDMQPQRKGFWKSL